MRQNQRGAWGLALAVGAVLFAQGGTGPLLAATPAAMPSPTPAGGGGGPASAGPDYGPLIVPIDGGNRRGVDAVGGGSPSPAGGGGGEGGGASFQGDDQAAPTLMGPWFLRFEPPPDRLNGTGPGGSPEPTLAPGSPAPRR